MKTEDVLEREGSKYFVTDPETGFRLELKGYGSLKGKLELDSSIDLTKPIWEQVYGDGFAAPVRSCRSKRPLKRYLQIDTWPDCCWIRMPSFG